MYALRKKSTEAAKKRCILSTSSSLSDHIRLDCTAHITLCLVPCRRVIVVRCAILVSLNWRYSFYFPICWRRRWCACVLPKPISCWINATMCFCIMLVIFVGYSFNPFGVSFVSVCLHNHSHHCNFHAVISPLKGFICNLICTVDRNAKWWRRMKTRINCSEKHVVNSFSFDFSSSWSHFLVVIFAQRKWHFWCRNDEHRNYYQSVRRSKSIMYYLNNWMLWNFMKTFSRALRQFKLYTIRQCSTKKWKKFPCFFRRARVERKHALELSFGSMHASYN